MSAGQRLGLIVNPHAGRGGAHNLEVSRRLVDALRPAMILVGPGDLGADALGGVPVAPQIVDPGAARGRDRTSSLTRQMAAQGIDVLAVVGGDGTMADVAFALWTGGTSVPILGIGVGSANVGPLVACKGDSVSRLATASLASHPVDGLMVGANGAVLGLAFNDVVFGFTVLATVHGQVVDVDAAQKMFGRNVPREPEGVWTGRTWVVKQGPHHETLVALGNQVETVIIGLPDERFYGKAIAGGVLLSSLAGDPAGCLVCDHLLVRTRLDTVTYRQSEPVVSRYVGLGPEETITGYGFRAGTVLCADGNPLAILGEDDRAQVRVQRAIARALRLAEGQGQ